MTYIKYSLKQIADAVEKDKNTVIKIETSSGDQRPRTLRILEIGDDYIIARGRIQKETEVFNFNQVASWRFIPYQADDWKWELK
jgi:hypothetical protein